jgi:hypothetical protein
MQTWRHAGTMCACSDCSLSAACCCPSAGGLVYHNPAATLESMSKPRDSVQMCNILPSVGRVVAQKLRPNRAARVRAHIKWCEIYGGQSRIGTRSLQILALLLPIIPPNAPVLSASTIQGWYSSTNSGRLTNCIICYVNPRRFSASKHIKPAQGTG